MMKLKICMCILIAILLIVLTPTIFTSYPVLINLFTDTINYILIMLVIIFIMVIDVCCGATLAIVILYMAVYINTNITNKETTTKKYIKTPMNTLPDFIKIVPNNTSLSDNSVIDNNTTTYNPNANANANANPNPNANANANACNGDKVTDDSEFIYDNTKPFPNNNLKPFQPKDYDTNENTEQKKKTLNFVQETINQEYLNTHNDRITRVDEPDRSGYDVSGCRYDMKNSPQNLTQYGPPVSQCSAYDPVKAQICGTVFYPLNA